MNKKILLISGISIVAVGLGAILGYRLYKRWNKDEIKGKHNTILVEKEINYDEVEVIGEDGKITDWTDYYAEYYGAPEVNPSQAVVRDKELDRLTDFYAEYYGAPKNS